MTSILLQQLRMLEDDHDHDHDHDHDDHLEEGSTDLSGFKVGICFGMFLVCLLGAIPFCVPACVRSKQFLSYLNCFAGGLFFAMAFIHIMPEADEVYEGYVVKKAIEHGEDEHDIRIFPLPNVLAFVGYLLILVVDKVLSQQHQKKTNTQNTVEDAANANSKAPDATSRTDEGNNSNGVQNETAKKEKVPLSKQCCSGSTNRTKFTSALVLALSLCVHSVFEGMVLGLLESSDSLIQLSLGILIHKGVAAVSLGATLANSGLYTIQNFVVLSIFAAAAPLGVIIGMAVHDTSPLVDSIFMAISGGTFIYVACTEIIVHEFENSTGRCMNFGKSIMVFLGALLITCLWFIEGDHHDH